MSNPNISRWGFNLFWYKFWYYDKNYYLALQHDILINKLIYTFLNFGILFPTNIFVNKYWFRSCEYVNYFNSYNTKYYRIMGFKNLISKEMNYYKERIKIENVYQSKIWILKFHHWIVINFYSFSPLKKKRPKDKSVSHAPHLDSFLMRAPYNFENYKRLKLIFFYFFKKIKNSNYFYKF